MYFKRIFCLIILVSILISMNMVSASDLNDTTTEIITQFCGVNEQECDNLEITQNNQIVSQDRDSHIIYVGQNKTNDGGNGTHDNPFGSFQIACNNLKGEENVEINVYNGTYYLNSDLKFNTSNLLINGMGNVLIKNLENKEGCHASFGLISSNGNFTFSNLIFDGSNCTSISSVSGSKPTFNVFKGTANLGTLYNCTFKGFNDTMMFSNQFDKKFIRCNFIDTYYISLNRWYDGLMIDFEYCIIPNSLFIGIPSNGSLNLTYNKVWLGSNRIDEYLYYNAFDLSGLSIQAKANLIKYAVFSAHEHYLGNDTYEIIGKLTWNDSTSDGIELLNPMDVKISSRTGEIQKTTILKNGAFNLVYKSNSKDNSIEIELDSQEIILEFKNGVNVVANQIYVGDEQTITVILPQSINGIVNITVNNKTYEAQSNDLSVFNFTIPDELLAGNYQVDVSIIDTENHVYGFDSTNWTISKINKDMMVVTPAKSYITDTSLNITVLLEKDASGNITVLSGNKNITKECYGQNIEIDVLSLINSGENEITVIYSGNKKYLSQTKHIKIFVNKIYPNINITKPLKPTIGDEINITVSLPLNASGRIIVAAGDKNLSINNVSGENIIAVSVLLNTGFNSISVRYSGDDFWDSQIKKETIYVDKQMPIMAVNSNQSVVKIGENITIEISLPEDASGNLSINENYLINIAGECTIINISSSIAGINHVNVTYNGNDKYHSHSQLINLTVEKWDISSNEINILVVNHTNPNFEIHLPNDVYGNVTLIINGKEYIESLVNGSASFKIYDLMPGEYNAIVVYQGNGKYNQFSINAKFSVPKPVLKANNINMLYTSGLKYKVHVTAGGTPVIGKKITLIINGKKTTAITDNKGYASVKINLPPKSTKYSVVAQYQGVKITSKVKVNSILQAKNLNVKKSAKTLKIKVSLKKINKKYLKGKKITLKFKGKKYTVKTNKNGIAIFKINKNTIKKLKVGKKYNYQVNYLKDSLNMEIKVKK